jgi:hypothetical protein
MIPSFPSYVATSTTTTLSLGIGVNDNSLTPTSMVGFPTSKGFVIQIDNELIQVGTTGATNWLDLVRGVNGTTEAAHAPGATITLMIGEPSAEFPLAGTWGGPNQTLVVLVDDDRRIAGISAVLAVPTQVAPNLLQALTATLSTAQVEAMHGTPITIVPAPGAGLVLIVDSIVVQTKPGATQFTGGGVVTFPYHGTSVLAHGASDDIAAAVINSATGTVNQMSAVGAAIQPPSNTGLDITNASAAFATGNGSLVVTVNYHVITLG